MSVPIYLMHGKAIYSADESKVFGSTVRPKVEGLVRLMLASDHQAAV